MAEYTTAAADSLSANQPVYTGSTPTSVDIGGVTYGADSGFDLGNLAKIAGIVGMGAGLVSPFLGGSGPQEKPSVPKYTATRQQLAIPQNRRPGSGGVTYFSPMQYSYTGVTPQTPQEFLSPAAAPAAAPVAAPALSVPQGFNVSGLASITNRTPQEVQSLLTSNTGIYTLLGELFNRLTPPESYRSGGQVGIGSLGSYSDGGRLLKGPGDGVSDDIPATIGDKQPARLADGEFVVPARIVSELGNGSTEAGARKLYAMMERIKAARRKANRNIAADTNADKYLPV